MIDLPTSPSIMLSHARTACGHYREYFDDSGRIPNFSLPPYRFAAASAPRGGHNSLHGEVLELEGKRDLDPRFPSPARAACPLLEIVKPARTKLNRGLRVIYWRCAVRAPMSLKKIRPSRTATPTSRPVFMVRNSQGLTMRLRRPLRYGYNSSLRS